MLRSVIHLDNLNLLRNVAFIRKLNMNVELIDFEIHIKNYLSPSIYKVIFITLISIKSLKVNDIM